MSRGKKGEDEGHLRGMEGEDDKWERELMIHMSWMTAGPSPFTSCPRSSPL